MAKGVRVDRGRGERGEEGKREGRWLYKGVEGGKGEDRRER